MFLVSNRGEQGYRIFTSANYRAASGCLNTYELPDEKTAFAFFALNMGIMATCSLFMIGVDLGIIVIIAMVAIQLCQAGLKSMFFWKRKRIPVAKGDKVSVELAPAWLENEFISYAASIGMICVVVSIKDIGLERAYVIVLMICAVAVSVLPLISRFVHRSIA